MAEEENKEGGDSFKRIERGDYLIQVHVIECRELKARDSGDTNDPVCQVTVMGQKSSTKIHERTLSCVFDERLYFDFQDLEADEINQGKVSVELFDANVLFPNVLIGMFEFDLMEIYYREHHELYKQWVALSDVTDANEGVQGYLQVTVVILGPGDEQFIHDEQAEAAAAAAAGGGGLLDVLMPPQVEQDPKLLRVHVYRLEKLPAMDISLIGGVASTDPYVQVLFAGVDNRTTTKEQVQDAAIKETLTIPVIEPVMARQIIISVKDSDFGSDAADDLIGTVIFNYRELKKGNVAPRWVHLYGAPITNTYFDTVQQDKMNRGVLPGSEFRGSMMLALDIVEDDEPKAERFEAKWNDDLEPQLEQYALEIDVYQAVECKDSIGKYRLELCIRDMKLQTEWAECIQGTCEWYEIFADPVNKSDTILLNMPDEYDQCPDLIFYLVEESTGRFSYKRFSWGEICNMSWFTPPKWYAFTEDKVSYQYTDEDFPGNVLMGLRAGPAHFKPRNVSPQARPFLHLDSTAEREDMDVSDFLGANLAEGLARKVSTMPSVAGQPDANLTLGSLVLTVVECNYLPPNMGDVYVECILNAETVVTPTRRNKTNPEWNHPFDFRNVSIHDEVKVILKATSYLGVRRVVIGELERVVLMSVLRDAEVPQGTDFSHSKRFYIGEDDAMITLKFTFKYDRSKRRRKRGHLNAKAMRVAEMGRPYPANFQMRVYVYQARDLEPRDDNGLSDPYFRITYCGQKEETSVINRNLNPQWLQLMLMNVQVPQPADYAPRIQCAVYDSDDIGFGLTGGYFDDMIGRFFVTFEKCLEMVKLGKPQWFQLQDVHGNDVSGQVYLAIQFSDPNKNPEEVFKINVQTHQYFLHILTLGVRALRSAFGVNKPQITYTTNKGKEVETDPSSNPDPPNANFRVVRKVPLDIPDDFEMAPAINIVAKDQLFGGLITNILGHGSIRLNKFMEPIPNHPENRWNVKYMQQTILNEEEILREEQSEAVVELRFEQSERRSERVSVRKVILESEAECEGVEVDMKQMDLVLEYSDQQVTEKDAVVHVIKKKRRKTQIEEESDSDEQAANTVAAKAQMEADMLREQEAAEQVLDGLDELDDLETGDTMHGDVAVNKVDDLEEQLKAQVEAADREAAEAEAARLAEIEANQVDMADIEAEKNRKKKKKGKKERDKAKVKAWEKGEREFAYDIDSPLPYNPDDDVPEYMKGRDRVRNELEDEVEMLPFENIDLWTGQNGTIGGWNERRVIGQLKGLWRLDISDKNPFGKGLTSLVQTKTVAIRVYVLKGRQLFPMDSDNSSDPYLIVRLGRLEFSTVDRYIPNTLDPKFHESFEFMSKIPGPSKLEVEVWDYDLLGHDLIGTTVVDIEDRWFSKEWRRMKLKPLEERTLHNPRSRASYGKLELWVNMMSKEDARNTPMVDISLPPIIDFELRVVAWKAKHVTIKDEMTEQNDLYVTVQVDGEEQQSQDTDTHFRAKAQRGSWNWRMLFPFHLPTERTTHIRFSMWDFDIIGANDMIGEIGFGLDQLLRQAYKIRDDKPKMVLKKGGKKQFWLDVFHPEFEGSQGKLQVSMEILTGEHSEKNPAGLGRSDPNTNPWLPPPDGRMIWSLNPFTMLRQLLGDKLCAKVCALFCVLIFGVLLVFLGPQLLINFLSKILHI